MTGIVFYNLDMQTDGITTTNIEAYSSPPISLDVKSVAQSDVSVLIDKQLQPKIILAEGILQQDTTAELDTLIDDFQTGLNARQKKLRIEHAGGEREYIATTQNIAIGRSGGLNRATFSVEFLCVDPLGKDVDETTMLSDSTTIASDQFAITVGGSYKAEPEITISYSVLTGGTTNKTVTLTNTATQESISITRDWASSDTLVIDNLNKTVFVNDGEVEPSGRFLEFASGSGTIAYADDFTTRTASITIKYTKRYL